MLCFWVELLILKHMLHRFLVGEGARAWAKSKDIVSDEKVDEVVPWSPAENMCLISPSVYNLLFYILK